MTSTQPDAGTAVAEASSVQPVEASEPVSAGPEKYTAEWVRQQVAATGAVFLEHHDCSLCGVIVGYLFDPPDRVAFRSGCGCSWSPDRPSSYEEIAAELAMQDSDQVRDRIMSGLRSPQTAPK